MKLLRILLVQKVTRTIHYMCFINALAQQTPVQSCWCFRYMFCHPWRLSSLQVFAAAFRSPEAFRTPVQTSETFTYSMIWLSKQSTMGLCFQKHRCSLGIEGIVKCTGGFVYRRAFHGFHKCADDFHGGVIDWIDENQPSNKIRPLHTKR